MENPELNWAPYLNEKGKIKKTGDMIIDLEFANTLEQIAKDKDTFYSGDLAKTILADLQGNFVGKLCRGKFRKISLIFLVNFQ